jgi:hypothetical protein
MLGARGHRVTIAPHAERLGRPELDQRTERVGESSFSWGIGRWRPGRPTVVYVGTVAIGLTLFELSEEAVMRYVDGKYVRVTDPRVPASPTTWTTTKQIPSGQLALRAYSPYHVAKWEREWREERSRALGGMLPAIVEDLERDAATVARLVEEGERRAAAERAKWEAEHRAWEAKRRAEEEEQRRREAARLAAEAEERRTKALQDEVARWKFAHEIREYVAAKEDALAAEGCRVTPGGPFEQWTQWARAHADQIDPLHQLRLQAQEVIREHRAKAEAMAAAAGATLVPEDDAGETAS